MFDFTGKKVLVTGSSQGIGKACALEFARHHAKTFVHASVSLEKAQGVCDEIKKEVTRLMDKREKLPQAEIEEIFVEK